jgi:hypothetical protein
MRRLLPATNMADPRAASRTTQEVTAQEILAAASIRRTQ